MIVAVTGLGLLLFVIAHMLGNLQIYAGPRIEVRGRGGDGGRDDRIGRVLHQADLHEAWGGGQRD